MRKIIFDLSCAYYTMLWNMKHRNDINIPWRFIVAIADYETGTFTSNLFKTANNAFGMRPATSWKQWRNGITDSNFCTYFTPWGSVRDYFKWCELNNMTFVSGGAWIEQMGQHGYFGSQAWQSYWSGVQSRIDQADKTFNPWIVVIPTVLFLAFMAVYKRKELVKQLKQWMKKMK